MGDDINISSHYFFARLAYLRLLATTVEESEREGDEYGGADSLAIFLQSCGTRFSELLPPDEAARACPLSWLWAGLFLACFSYSAELYARLPSAAAVLRDAPATPSMAEPRSVLAARLRRASCDYTTLVSSPREGQRAVAAPPVWLSSPARSVAPARGCTVTSFPAPSEGAARDDYVLTVVSTALSGAEFREAHAHNQQLQQSYDARVLPLSPVAPPAAHQFQQPTPSHAVARKVTLPSEASSSGGSASPAMCATPTATTISCNRHVAGLTLRPRRCRSLSTRLRTPPYSPPSTTTFAYIVLTSTLRGVARDIEARVGGSSTHILAAPAETVTLEDRAALEAAWRFLQAETASLTAAVDPLVAEPAATRSPAEAATLCALARRAMDAAEQCVNDAPREARGTIRDIFDGMRALIYQRRCGASESPDPPFFWPAVTRLTPVCSVVRTVPT